MASDLSARLARIVEALPLTPDARVLEIGRSAKAVAQVRANAAAEIASGRLSVRLGAAEDFELEAGEEPYDLVFAVRVGALDGRHPELERRVLGRIAAALAPGGRVFVDTGDPLRELEVASAPR